MCRLAVETRFNRPNDQHPGKETYYSQKIQQLLLDLIQTERNIHYSIEWIYCTINSGNIVTWTYVIYLDQTQTEQRENSLQNQNRQSVIQWNISCPRYKSSLSHFEHEKRNNE